MNKISNIPPKGTADWFPDEYMVRKYIFDTWRKVCISFGYEEYLTPMIEYAEVYRAKSGEDVGGKELTVFTDRGGRELAIRPEMTPSVTRMVSRIYENSPKPLRLFSIANFLRNEKPQKGRNREFWQLNCDIFGSDSINADLEIFSLAIELMKAFGATKDDFKVLINDRRLIKLFITDILKINEDKTDEAVRILDKFWKISNEEFLTRLKTETGAKFEDDKFIIDLIKGDDAARHTFFETLKDNPYASEIREFAGLMDSVGYGGYGMFDLSLVRGFDYYDGLVFEVYDANTVLRRQGVDVPEPAVDRSLFGGGRYNGLAGIFGSKSFPAVGFAPGDETMRIFLEGKGLLKDVAYRFPKYYIPMLEGVSLSDIYSLAEKLRKENNLIVIGTEIQKLGKAFEYGDKAGFDFVAILGENELKDRKFSVKQLDNGEQVLRDL